MTRLFSKNLSIIAALSWSHRSPIGLKTYQITASSCRHSSGIAADAEWQNAKPLLQCPTLKPMEAILGFTPFGKFYQKDLDHFVRILQKEKGPIIFMPGIFGRGTTVMTSNPDDFEKVFRRESTWPLRKGFETLTYHRQVYRKDYFEHKTGLLTSKNQEWSDFRTAVNPIIIHPKNVKMYLPILSKVNEDFIARIKAIRDPNTLEVPANFKDEISSWTLESVGVVALDQRLGAIGSSSEQTKKFFNNIKEFFELCVELEIKPSLWQLYATKAFKRQMKVLDELSSFVQQYVNEALQRIESSTEQQQNPAHEASVLQKLLKVDKKIAFVMAMDMLVAGVDTTSSTFAGLLLNLAKNPQKQEKLRQEILGILPNKDSELNVQNMKNMPYLRACIKESLRVHPLTSANVRTTVEDLVLSNYQVPKNTHVVMVNMGLLESNEHFPRANEFIPERWLRQPTAAADHSAKCPMANEDANVGKTSHPFVYLPFGFGPRSCIGRRIAEMELEIGISRILRNFKVEFNHSSENAFIAYQIRSPAIPLQFKFTDLDY